MSVVTTMILLFQGCESRNIREVNAYFTNKWERFHRLGGYFGGEWEAQAEVYGITVNHLDLEGFVAHLRTKVNWDDAPRVQLIVKTEGSDRFGSIPGRTMTKQGTILDLGVETPAENDIRCTSSQLTKFMRYAKNTLVWARISVILRGGTV